MTGPLSRPLGVTKAVFTLRSSAPTSGDRREARSSLDAYVARCLRAEPGELVFERTDATEPTRKTVLIRNLSKQAQRIRLSLPEGAAFHLVREQSESVAAGLSAKVDVVCHSGEIDETPCSLTASCEGCTIHIPLLVVRARAVFDFDTAISFGCLRKDQTCSKRVLVRNRGSRTGYFAVTYSKQHDACDVIFDPPSFSVPPRQAKEVTVTFYARNYVSFQGTARVRLEGCSTSATITQILLFAEVIQQKLSFNLNNTPVSRLDFGKVYFGSATEKLVTLKNQSPSSLSFVIHTKDHKGPGTDVHESERDPPQTSASLTAPAAPGFTRSRFLKVSPQTGTIEPWGELPVTVRLESETYQHCHGFQKTFLLEKAEVPVVVQLSVRTEEGSGETLEAVDVCAQLCIPSLQVVPPVLRYDACRAGFEAETVLTIENRHPDLELDYAFSKVSQLLLLPERGCLAPLESRPVIVKFAPANPMKLACVLRLAFCRQLYTVDIPVNMCSVPSRPAIGSRLPAAKTPNETLELRYASCGLGALPESHRYKETAPGLPGGRLLSRPGGCPSNSTGESGKAHRSGQKAQTRPKTAEGRARSFIATETRTLRNPPPGCTIGAFTESDEVLTPLYLCPGRQAEGRPGYQPETDVEAPHAHHPDELIKRKYTHPPKNKAEIRASCAELDDRQLSRISVGPQTQQTRASLSSSWLRIQRRFPRSTSGTALLSNSE
ncbi:flagellar associated protein [Cystoisospora suis]|uniref:Flagellar associated protein n=1 Tax=Cystoisospora suis TaxID=483139 RepID=A0A2C6KFT2_9APIC|nr:flagellar associated protein [Cystoisospora suis]